MPLTQEQILDALKQCYDPEIPVNIVDLGLIYEVKLGAGDGSVPQPVEVVMTMTSPGCPAHASISEQVKERVHSLPGVSEVKVDIVWTPPWTPERLSPAARKQLGIE